MTVPAIPGTYRVIATSIADPTRSAEAALEVIDNKLIGTQTGSSYQNLFFSSDGQRLAASFSGSYLDVWDTATRQRLFTIPGSIDGYVYDAKFSPDGTTLAVASNNAVKQYNAATGTLLRSLSALYSGSVTYSADGTKIAAVGSNINIWNAVTGAIIRTIVLPQGQNILAFNADASQIATSGNGIAVWDAATGNLIKQLASAGTGFSVVGFSSDESVITHQNMNINYWSVATGSIVKRVALEWPDTGSPTMIKVTPDGQQVVAYTNNSTLLYWDGVSGALLRTYPLISGGIQTVGISPSSMLFASGGQINIGTNPPFAQIWRLDTIVRSRSSR